MYLFLYWSSKTGSVKIRQTVMRASSKKKKFFENYKKFMSLGIFFYTFFDFYVFLDRLPIFF